MRNRILAFSTLFLLALAIVPPPASADDDRWDRRGNRGRGRNDGYSDRSSFDPVRQTLRDVQFVWSRSRVDGHERDHFRNVVDSLERFQDQAARGRFDRGRLDRVIDNLEHLAQAHQIHPQGRNLLRQRLFDLRSFREDGGFGWRGRH